MILPPAFTAACDDFVISVIENWVTYMESERALSSYTITNYLCDLQAFLIFLQTYEGHQVTKGALKGAGIQTLRALLAQRLGEGVSHRSNARLVSSLKAFYKYCQQRHNLENADIALLKSAKFLSSLPRPLTEEDAQAVIHEGASFQSDDQVIKNRDRALWALLYGCGLRISEALALTINDIQQAGTTITIKGKGRKERMVPILPEVKVAVKAHLKTHPDKHNAEAPLFLGVRGNIMSARTAQHRMREFRMVLGLPETATPHALRHSFATHMMQSGADLRTIQDLLGHASLSTTQKYTEIETSHLAEVYKKTHPKS